MTEVFISATRLHILTTAKIYRINTYNKVNPARLFDHVFFFFCFVVSAVTLFSAVSIRFGGFVSLLVLIRVLVPRKIGALIRA